MRSFVRAAKIIENICCKERPILNTLPKKCNGQFLNLFFLFKHSKIKIKRILKDLPAFLSIISVLEELHYIACPGLLARTENIYISLLPIKAFIKYHSTNAFE